MNLGSNGLLKTERVAAAPAVLRVERDSGSSDSGRRQHGRGKEETEPETPPQDIVELSAAATAEAVAHQSEKTELLQSRPQAVVRVSSPTALPERHLDIEV